MNVYFGRNNVIPTNFAACHQEASYFLQWAVMEQKLCRFRTNVGHIYVWHMQPFFTNYLVGKIHKISEMYCVASYTRFFAKITLCNTLLQNGSSHFLYVSIISEFLLINTSNQNTEIAQTSYGTYQYIDSLVSSQRSRWINSLESLLIDWFIEPPSRRTVPPETSNDRTIQSIVSRTFGLVREFSQSALNYVYRSVPYWNISMSWCDGRNTV